MLVFGSVDKKKSKVAKIEEKKQTRTQKHNTEKVSVVLSRDQNIPPKQRLMRKI